MLESLITSKTRIKLLVKFFINAKTTAYLRNLEVEFGESTNAIRLELNRFEDAGLLVSETKANRKYFKANTQHTLFSDIHHLLLKHVGIDTIVDEVANNIGNLEKVFITGDLAQGIQSRLVDITMVGNDFDHNYLNELIRKAEDLVSFKIRYFIVSSQELMNYLSEAGPYMVVWSNEK
jgi:hypothetical protein